MRYTESKYKIFHPSSQPRLRGAPYQRAWKLIRIFKIENDLNDWKFGKHFKFGMCFSRGHALEVTFSLVCQFFYRLCHPFIGHFRLLVKIPSNFLGLMLYLVPESKLVKISHLDSFLLAVLVFCFCWIVSILDNRPCTVIGDAIVTLQQVIEYL